LSSRAEIPACRFTCLPTGRPAGRRAGRLGEGGIGLGSQRDPFGIFAKAD